MNTRHENTDADARLDKALNELPIEIQPKNDLWLIISQAIANGWGRKARDRRRPLFVRLAIAASLVVVSSLATSWWIAQSDSRQRALAVNGEFTRLVGPVILPASYDETQVPGARYLQDRAELVQALEKQILLLPEETRLKVASDLLAIQRALQDISRELTGDPGNVFLQQLLLTMYQRELMLLDDLNQITAAVKAQRTVI
ncbi:MAG: hypothetical protein O7C03_04170 [Gammaproteobacteria bacterium]|nr:hypothetical protein [Gammaproteobacteria bacterium]